jgi:hypothetical protein
MTELSVGTIGVRRSTYDSELEEDKNRAATLARLLEEQTLRNFEAVDLVLQAAIDTIPTAT